LEGTDDIIYNVESDGGENMSRFHQEYRNAEPLNIVIDRAQYDAMMTSKRNIMDFGARLLSGYRARRRAA